jgi:hypothetical protein
VRVGGKKLRKNQKLRLFHPGSNPTLAFVHAFAAATDVLYLHRLEFAT